MLKIVYVDVWVIDYNGLIKWSSRLIILYVGKFNGGLLSVESFIDYFLFVFVSFKIHLLFSDKRMINYIYFTIYYSISFKFGLQLSD